MKAIINWLRGHSRGASASGGGGARGRRTEPRLRARFYSAKALDRNSKFLCDCIIVDRSKAGLGLRLSHDVELDDQFKLHDDQTKEILGVAVAWRRGLSVGVRVLHRNGVATVKPVDHIALSKQYYAITD